MGAFDSFSDAPAQLRTEGQKIELSFTQGDPTTGQGTVRWNVPAPARGCVDDEGAYAGYVVLLADVPLAGSNIPQEGVRYTADPVADPDLHTGDRINGALVIGAFYECEKKGTGEEFTTEFVVSDVDPSKDYYVAGYAVDCQGRYHQEGNRAYSDTYGSPDGADGPSTQVIQMADGSGVLPTDGTGLVPGFIYQFDLFLQDGPASSNQMVIELDGIDAGTYEQLLAQINKQILLIENPPQSPVPPNQGRYFWDVINQQLYQWDGFQHVLIPGVIIEPTDPANPALGDYWHKNDTNELFRWNVPNPTGWNPVSVISYIQDPRNLKDCDDYWYDGTNAWQWCATTWCEQILTTSNVDPSCPREPDCGLFWYDEVNSMLFEWSVDEQRWVEVFAIYWPEAPNALSDGTYWVNSTNNELFERQAGAWVNLAVTVDEEEPTSTFAGQYWYDPSTEELRQRNAMNTDWNLLDVLVWPDDPTDTESCDLWWNSTTDVLSKWDKVHNEWDQVAEFIQSEIDPLDPPILEIGELWLNPDDGVMQRWDGSNWIPVTYIEYPTDPTMPAQGTAWHNPATDEWFIWDLPLAGEWNPINPIDTPTDPFLLPSGSWWFDTTNNTLNERVGSTWVNVPYSTVPFTPSNGDRWYDSVNCILYEWDSKAGTYVQVEPDAFFFIDKNGNICLTTTALGSLVCGAVLVPGFPNQASVGTGFANFGPEDIQGGSAFGAEQTDLIDLPEATVGEDTFLFNFLVQGAQVGMANCGTDGVSGTPSYQELGIGTDGSPDERRELMDSIRRQLGYPVVTVELDNYQMDTAITAALESYRKRSSNAYKRGFFFLDMMPGVQHYKLTNKRIGYDKIVTVMSAYRFTSAFLSSAHGAGVYGQVVLQHLYNMGTYDLTSFHLVAQYVEQLEHLFATRLTYHWHEADRLLSLYHSFVRDERILLDCTVERTEQELLTDRYSKTWIERYALAEAMTMLAQIRGKYGSLPGAGGGISLNASELIALAAEYRQDLYEQLDNFVSQDVEDIGMHSTLIIG